MKKILITGKDSYIGTSLEKWLSKEPDNYKVDTLDMRDDGWRNKDFSEYDAIFHVAAIVHKKEKKELKSLYFKVNRDLPIEVAKKAKVEGVKQFIFMSSMSVYGIEGKIGEEVVIDKETLPKPKSYYGMSKYEAENQMKLLTDKNFNVAILRPPMVYGDNCPGNYARLESLAIRTPIFPMIENKRSMIHIDKLCEYIKKYIDNNANGVFLPQDDDYVNTSLLVKKIAHDNGREVVLSNSIGKIIKVTGRNNAFLSKIFGNLIYIK
ncbi:NAD-dependent epimerase/dehydratase family protein [Clostridium sp. SHJSY1]|uniref:NAD-dependent epimerase/dehydratase family protein n=1 Tax=Clostridium sp. SHJSY1 TaxID=2942483 RepID=UPI002874FB55|nr:NAD-dependent epimerase/dehydratase family protein [Clostridium sp. SHJSY1]MDS0526519.1 NAD-dependent epimerase/dehydratase family protein [Clostridium sp. SHJSY1]